MVLTLYEEQSYTSRQLRERVAEALDEADQEGERIAAAVQALCSVSLPRAAFVQPGRWGSAGDREATAEDPADEDIDADEGEATDRIPLLSTTRAGHWKVSGIVGSGTLEDHGLDVEILPKVSASDDVLASRRSLLHMWNVAAGIRPQDHEAPAGVEAPPQMHLHEWLIDRFLGELEALLLRGIRMRYVEREDNLLVMRGRVLAAQNMRLNRFAPHRFFCRYEELSPDRPENRLIRAALERVLRWTTVVASRRRALSLADRLDEVPPSRRIAADFAAWRDDRLMTGYRDIRPTCRWILNEETPSPIHGKARVFGCFVRMSRLFEQYVAQWLAVRMQESERFRSLDLRAQEQKRFCWPWGASRGGEVMKPDLVIRSAGVAAPVAVLDTKWKRPRDDRFISRPDLFQMVSYGRFWLQETGDREPVARSLALIYPSVTGAKAPKHFSFAQQMSEIRLSMHWFRLPSAWNANGPGVEGLDLDDLIGDPLRAAA